jgi:hypothetical protein
VADARGIDPARVLLLKCEAGKQARDEWTARAQPCRIPALAELQRRGCDGTRAAVW